MLKSLRKHSKHPIAKVFLVIVLIAFAGLGLGSFVPSLQFNQEYIKAGDTNIGIQEIANQFNKLRAEVAPNLTVNEESLKGIFSIRNPNYNNSDKSVYFSAEASSFW